MITVACCLWGDWPERGWGEDYVVRLERAVERNLRSEPYRFVCFAEKPERLPPWIETRQLPTFKWQGCLPKLWVYSPDAGLEGQVLLLDLDNVVVGDLADMAAYRGPICARARLPEWDKGKRLLDGDMISFDTKFAKELWKRIEGQQHKIEHATGGRERFFIAHNAPEGEVWQEVCPGQVVSFKHHCRDGLPEGARVVSFHGDPRPHRVNKDWVIENWQ